MTVSELIAVLIRVVSDDPSVGTLTVESEGCDCIDDVVGVSVADDPVSGVRTLWIRIEGGCFGHRANCTYADIETLK